MVARCHLLPWYKYSVDPRQWRFPQKKGEEKKFGPRGIIPSLMSSGEEVCFGDLSHSIVLAFRKSAVRSATISLYQKVA